MTFDVIGHERLLREIAALAARDEPPHTVLLTGPAGVGRTLLATEFARLLNCEAEVDERPCGNCRPCHLIAAASHPDVVYLGPGDTLCRPRADETHEKHPQSRDIRICQVRGMIEMVARYPFEARFRVAIIEPADLFGEMAVQATLKTFEEPPAHTVFVLVTGAPEALPETVLSRCRRIDVGTVPRAEIETGLGARGFEASLAGRAAEHARGRPALALEYARHPDRMDDLARLLDRCANLVGAGIAERFVYSQDLSERWRRDRSLVHVELDAWEIYWERELRASADGSGQFSAEESLSALQAVLQARQDLHDLLMARAALDLMLLAFPKGRMEPQGSTPGPEEESVAFA